MLNPLNLCSILFFIPSKVQDLRQKKSSKASPQNSPKERELTFKHPLEMSA